MPLSPLKSFDLELDESNFDFDLDLPQSWEGFTADSTCSRGLPILKHMFATTYAPPSAADKIRESGKLAAILLANFVRRAANNVLVSGNFIFGDLLDAYPVHHNLFCPCLTMATISQGKEDIDILKILSMACLLLIWKRG